MNIKKEKRRVIKNALIKQIQVLEIAQLFLEDCLEKEQADHKDTMDNLKESDDLLKRAHAGIEEAIGANIELEKEKAKNIKLRKKIKRLKELKVR